MSIEHIPLSQLVPSPRNVRKTGGASIDDLAASIHAHGLLQNLVVSADGKGKFMVEAGQRRHQAMQLLVKADKLPAEYSVPCKVLDTGIRASTEASLAKMKRDQLPKAAIALLPTCWLPKALRGKEQAKVATKKPAAKKAAKPARSAKVKA